MVHGVMRTHQGGVDVQSTPGQGSRFTLYFPVAPGGVTELAAPAQVSPSNSLARLFAQWQAEDATDDPEEIARRERDWEELKANLDANRGPHQRKLFP